MKLQRLIRKPEVAWLLGVSLLLLLGFWWIPGERGALEDTWSVRSGGKKAFFRLTQRLLPNLEVARSTKALIPDDWEADTLFILGPARYPDPDEWDELYRWVVKGRTLIFAARANDANVDLGSFAVEIGTGSFLKDLDTDEEESDSVVPVETDDEDAPEPNGAEPIEPDSEMANTETPDSTTTTTKEEEEDDRWDMDFIPQTDLVEGSTEWVGDDKIDTKFHDADILVSDGFGNTCAARMEVGDGLLIVVNSDFIFANRVLLKERNATLAWRIAEAGAIHGPVYFDEFLNGSGAPKVVGILFNRALRPLTLQLMLVTLLFAWFGSRRFGAVRQTRPEARRRIVEHARALGQMQSRIGAGKHALEQHLEHFRNEMRLSFADGTTETEVIAARASADPNEVKQLMSAVHHAIDSPDRLATSAAARLIKNLSVLRHRATVGGKARSPD